MRSDLLLLRLRCFGVLRIDCSRLKDGFFLRIALAEEVWLRRARDARFVVVRLEVLGFFEM